MRYQWSLLVQCGVGEGMFFNLTFTMNSFQIKDLRKRVMLTQKIWLDAMNFPVKFLNSNQRPGLFYVTSESRGNADSPRHTSEVAKNPFKMIEQMSFLGVEMI